MNKNFTIACPEGFAPELLTREICKKIYAAGFYHISINIESGGKGKLKNDLNKSFDVDAWKKAVEVCYMSGFRKDQIFSSIILGLPGQSTKDLEETLRIFSNSGIRSTNCPFTPVPTTYFYNETDRYSGIDLELLDGELFPAIDDPELFKTIQNFRRLFDDCESVEINKKKKNYLAIIDKSKEEEMESNGKDLLTKIASVVLDIAGQNQEILDKISPIISRIDSLEKRIDDLEKVNV
jgi:hypothetical protein